MPKRKEAKSHPPPPDRTAEQVYSIALHDVRRMIETMRADEKLVAHVYRRLARAVGEVHGLPEIEKYAKDAESMIHESGDGPADS